MYTLLAYFTGYAFGVISVAGNHRIPLPFCVRFYIQAIRSSGLQRLGVPPALINSLLTIISSCWVDLIFKLQFRKTYKKPTKK
ncbi:hypothetical protein DFS33DRAFT_1346720 [Desarmillaria ectypa]|nr:hypothetical protein DFS33DRAFT_1346720 [Desarmillaria ectypa]